jgi:hypothetical protein
MWQLNIIIAVAIFSIFSTLQFLFMSQKRPRQTTNDGVTTFICDVDECLFETNSSRNQQMQATKVVNQEMQATQLQVVN